MVAKAKPLCVVVVTGDTSFFGAALGACADVAEGSPAVRGSLPPPPLRAEDDPLYVETLERARRYLERSAQRLAITVVQAPTLEAAAEALAATGPGAGPVGLVHVDGGDAQIEARLEAFYARLAAAEVAAVRSPYAVLVHRRGEPWAGGVHALGDRLLERVTPDSPRRLRAAHLTALLDFVERTFERPRNHKIALREVPSTLGDELVRFLEDRAGAAWTLAYYTGSSVSALIDHLERAAEQRGVIVLRGANEHGLASGALAGHLLYGRPFLMVIGAAMMDELRGTLANLRAAGARGFIVCPDADPGAHFPFQGLITADEDVREVLAARRIPHVYMADPDGIAEPLAEAFRLYEEGRGPVVLLVAQSVLDAKDPLPHPAYPPRAAPPAVSPGAEDAIAKALQILNRERARVLFQAGRLDAEEEDLVHAIAARAGVALVDTLAHPGPSHRGGRRVPYHLGTLGLYGFNQRFYAFLHEGNKLRPRAEQCVFLLKSKAGGRATNFTPSRRSGLRMVQLTERADHVAPDVEIALVMDALTFLRRALEGLDVDPAIVRWREEAIRAARPPGDDPASRTPALPMTPGWFFRELGALVERMIEEDGYAYTGVYDVGRSSVSATRAVPRTSRGYSGWYGRALMGDGPAALPALAVLAPGNVLAFVGDGGRSIIADPIPHVIENALAHPSRVDKNITIFYFSNGTFSGIRAYRERLASRWGGRQMRCVDLIEPDADRDLGPIHLVRRTLRAVDPAALREALLVRRRLNVFTVPLAHDADDDGFSFVTTGWQREHDAV